jgi:hypothetical protein
MFTKIDEGVVFSDVVAISSDVCLAVVTINSVIDSVAAALGYFFDLLYGLRDILLKTIFDSGDDIFHY